MKNSTDKEYPYEFICKDCGEDFASKIKKHVVHSVAHLT